MQIFYASRDGQARRIAERLAARFAERALVVVPQDLAGKPVPDGRDGIVVVVAAVRYGKHLPEAERFLGLYSRLAVPPPLVLLSVNLTARKPERRTAEESTYLRKTIRKHALKPVLARALAGRLDYARYKWFDRQMIRFIMKLTGGPTDPSVCIEYTDWNEVDALAKRIADISPT